MPNAKTVILLLNSISAETTDRDFVIISRYSVISEITSDSGVFFDAVWYRKYPASRSGGQVLNILGCDKQLKQIFGPNKPLKDTDN